MQLAHIVWNYATFLNIGFGLLAIVILGRLYLTSGLLMLRLMSAPGKDGSVQHGHGAG